ncbi:DUF3046 domain-containing protein [Microbacterium sp. cf332]|uniref:DUF3046 domain-containing protein n=1 Tax=Microbacterium sp. cf332 TaxID=1761804 RepID=UPI000884E17D|nr:DUF3046 domain-containing protein [Microbacterium sp. cf332]SDQ20921.1 Protein of unknown function [Microbacterium sp. cf332]
MRRSEFDRAVAAEFGGRGAALVDDLTLAPLGDRTARQALADGESPRAVWMALCVEADVPEGRRYGVGHLDPRGR